MDLPVLQIDRYKFRHATRTCQDYIYIYTFPRDFWYMYTSKTSDRNGGGKLLKISRHNIYIYIYTRNLDIFIKKELETIKNILFFVRVTYIYIHETSSFVRR